MGGNLLSENFGKMVKELMGVKENGSGVALKVTAITLFTFCFRFLVVIGCVTRGCLLSVLENCVHENLRCKYNSRMSL